MKKILMLSKKMLLLVMLIAISVLFIGCKKEQYVLELKFDSQIRVEEVIEATFKVVTINQEFDTTGIDLELKSMDPTIATVNGTNILGVGAGVVDIAGKVVYEGQELHIIKKLTVSPKIALELECKPEINIEEEAIVSFEVLEGETKLDKKNATLTLESLNPEIVTVNANVITGVKLGTAEIKGLVRFDHYEATAIITVTVNPEFGLNMICDSELVVSESTEISFEILNSATPIDISENSVVYTIADDDIVSIEGNTITALAAGTTSITATLTVKGQQLTTTKTITVIPVISVANKTETLEYGDYLILAFKNNLTNETYNTTISSSDSQIAWVRPEGLLGFGIGKSNITVKATIDGEDYTDTFELEIIDKTYPVEKIDIEGSNVVTLGKYTELKHVLFPAVATDTVTWQSSNTSIISIDENGRASGISEGVATITATSEKYNVATEITIKVIAAGDFTSSNGATYYIDEVTEYNDLPYGVVQTTNSAFTSTVKGQGDADGYSGIVRDLELGAFYHQQVNVLEVPSNKDVKIVPWANFNNHEWSLTTVKGLINDYEKKNAGWKVIAAINGDFFDINAEGAYGSMPYQTKGPVTVEGENYRTYPSDTLGFKNDGSTNPLIGNKTVTRSDKMKLAIYDNEGNIIITFDIDQVNSDPQDGQTSVYYSFYNQIDGKQQFVERSIQTDKPLYVIETAALALPCRDVDFYGKGQISKLAEANEVVALTKGTFAISSTNQEVLAALKVGTTVRVQYDIVGDYASATSLAGYQSTIVYEGRFVQEINDFTGTRAPRTAIGVKPDGTIVMMVIDGRQGTKNNHEGMYGADFTELAAIMDHYGCTSYYNLDGGGSSTMVIRDSSGLRVLNSPSDKRERSDGNCILIVTKDPTFSTSVLNTTTTSVKLNVEATEANDVDIDKVYLKIGNDMHEVINNTVEITNLVHNCQYEYTIYYSNSEGNLYKTMTSGNIKTEKVGCEFLGLILIETDTAYTIKIRGIDLDGISTMKNALFYYDESGSYGSMKGNYETTILKSKINGIQKILIKYYISGVEINETVELNITDYLYIDNTTK